MLEKIKNIVNENNEYRSNTINLIASENIMLKEAQPLYCSDFMFRYAEGKPYERYYNGTKYIDELESLAINYFKSHFNAEFCDIRPISGAIANLAVFSALKNKGIVITNSLPSGGHITHNKMGTLGRILNFEIYNFPSSENPYASDIDKSIKIIKEKNPDFIVFGKSMFLFKEPIKEIRDAFPDLKIVYDAAHVFGLVFQDKFQRPFKEGADIITASTHKTFPGPQGGIIIAKEYNKKIDRNCFPGIVSNHHLHRIAPLLATAYLLNTKYRDYAKKVIENAKAFAQALYENGFNVVAEEYGFTESHQIVIDVSSLGGGESVANVLEKNNIIVNKNALPFDKSVIKPSGIRLGVQEMTLKGYTKKNFKELAERFKKILLR